MSKNIHQIFVANPITSNASTDLMYFGQSPYGVGNDAGMTFANFAAQFAAPISFPIQPSLGGTGVNNGVNTLTLAGNLATSGAFASTFTMTGATNVTFPTSGTLSTTASLGDFTFTGDVMSNTTTNANITITPNGTGALLFGSPTLARAGDLNFQIAQNGRQGFLNLAHYINNSGGPQFSVIKSRSAVVGSFSPVQQNDVLMNFNIYGDDGTQLKTSAQILSQVTGAVSTNIIPSQWVFRTTNTSGVLITGMTLDNSQTLILAKALPIASGGTGLASTTANQLLYSSATNTIAGLSSANNGVLVTSGAGVPSISSTLPAAVQGNITALGNITNATLNLNGPGTVGNVALNINNDGSNASMTSLTISTTGTQRVSLEIASSSANLILRSSSTGGRNAGLSFINDAVSTTIPLFSVSAAGVPALNNVAALGSGTFALETDGTFTPVFNVGGSSVGVTYGIQVGIYSRIGNTVTFTIQLQITSIAALTGAFTVSGLPVASRNVTNAFSSFSCVVNGLTLVGSPVASLANNATSISLLIQNAGGVVTMTNTTYSGSSTFNITGAYLV